eukprot:1237783-Pyramimonas_sp.AAC.1
MQQYAKWEESQGDLARAASVWERTLDVDYHNVSVWLKYVDMEMRHRRINHARNLWDRCVSLLPRVDQLWYKYIHFEVKKSPNLTARQHERSSARTSARTSGLACAAQRPSMYQN